MTTGKSIEKTTANIREAIVGHVATLQKYGEPVPQPSSVATEVEVSTAA